MKRLRRLIGRDKQQLTEDANGNIFTAPDASLPKVTFRYKPLPNKSTIRVLHLQRRLRDINTPFETLPLRGSLIETRIDSGFQYFALSYTWGDPTLCETIEIDGKTLGITASCASALRRMMRGKSERYIWVDSICINQANTADALAERGSQVAMMDRIYRGAVKVLVHLGTGDAGTDVAIEALKGLAQYYMGAKHGINLYNPTAGLDGTMEDYRRKYEELADDVLAITPEYPYGKLYPIFRLPWFKRTWVVQEVVIGRDVMFYCGDKMLHMKLLLVGADFTKLPYSKLDATSNHWRSYVEFHDAMNEFVRRREEGEPLSNIAGLTLSAILIHPALTLEVTRPEDKVHAMYGICRRLGFELPEPDYNKSLATVYREAAQAMLRYDTDLDILGSACESSGWELGIPSWVPNLSGALRRWSPSNPPHTPIFQRTKSQVAGSSMRDFNYVLDGQGLQVKGRHFSEISAVGLPWMLDMSKTMLGGAPSADPSELLESLLTCLPSWVEIVEGGSDHPDTERAVQILTRALMQNTAKPLSAQELAALSRHYSVLTEWARSGSWLRMNEQASSLSPAEVVTTFQGIQAVAVVLNRMVGHYWKNVFRTANGHIGVGTHSIQQGDIMALFHGFGMVAVLRPWGEWYRYVGPAYVDGIMGGEFWSTTSSADDKWYTLV